MNDPCLTVLRRDEFYIEVVEQAFSDLDFSEMRGEKSPEEQAQNLNDIIKFLEGNVFSSPLDHIQGKIH